MVWLYPTLCFTSYRPNSNILKGGGVIDDMGGKSGRLVRWAANRSPPLTAIEGGISEELGNILTLLLMRKVWNKVKSILGITGLMNISPLWHNPELQELTSLTGFSQWNNKGVWNLSHIYSNGILKQYQQLCSEFGLPSSQFYRYLQLRHALEAQSKIAPVTFISNQTLNVVIAAGSVRGAISMVYQALLEDFLKGYPLTSRRQWERSR